MKLIFFVFFVGHTLSVASFAEELSCSRNGTTILYINGMFNSSEGSVESRNIIKNIYQGATRNEIDASGKVSLDHYYQRSLYHVSDKLGVAGQAAGAMSDIIQVVGQAVQGQIEGGDQDDATFWHSFSSYFFQGVKLGLNTDRRTKLTITAIGALDQLYQGLYVEELGDTVENEDLNGLMAKARQNLINDQKKMIIVSHSQGNFFANKLWTRFFDQSDADESYKDLWGNMQLAPPTSFIAASHGSYLKAAQDLVVAAIPGQGPNIYFERAYFSEDFKGHNVSLYLSPTIKASSSMFGSYDRTAQQIFRENMNSIAKSLAPNCGCEIADLPLRVHPYGGGLVGVNAVVADQARIDQGSFVCGSSNLSRYVRVTQGSTIRNSTIEAALSHMEREEIMLLGDLQAFNDDIIEIAHADIYDSTVKGRVLIGRRYGNDDNKRVTIRKNSSLISFDGNGEEYLRDGRLKNANIETISVWAGYDFDEVTASGSVSFNSQQPQTLFIKNSNFRNNLYGVGYNEPALSVLRVGSANISSSTFEKYKLEQMWIERNLMQTRNAVINNVRVVNSSLFGSFRSMSAGQLKVKDSNLSGNVDFSGSNEVEFLSLVVSSLASQTSDQISTFVNVRVTGEPTQSEVCNLISHPIVMNNAQIHCSTISSNGNIFQNVVFKNAHIYYANIATGSVEDSIVDRGDYANLTAENESYIVAIDEQSFSDLNVNQSHLNFTSLTHALEDITFVKTLLYGVSQLNIPSSYEFNNVWINVENLSIDQGVILDRVALGGKGEISLERLVNISNSSLWGDSADSIITVKDSATISDSRVFGDVQIEQDAKVLENSIIEHSDIRQGATVNNSHISSHSDVQSNAKVFSLSKVTGSIIEPSIEVISSDIREITLSESVSNKTCTSSTSDDFECSDGSFVTEWEPFEYVSPLEDGQVFDETLAGLTFFEEL